jgi:hypothetical protein
LGKTQARAKGDYMIKDGYEIIKIILDDDKDNPYYFFVESKHKKQAVKKIISSSSKWSVGEVKNQDDYAGYDDYLDELIQSGKIKVIPLYIEEYFE